MARLPSTPNDPLDLEVLSIPKFQREEFRSEMRADASAAVADFPSNFKALTDILSRLDCTCVLANFVYYGLQAAIDDHGRRKEMMPNILQHHAELLQAIVLTIHFPEWPGDPPTTRLEEIFDLMERLARVPLKKYVTAAHDEGDGSLAVEELLVRMRLSTQAVRNWDYYQDTITTAKKLYGPLGPRLRSRLHFDIVDLVTLASTIVSQVEDRKENHMSMLGRVMRGKTEEEQLERYYEWKSHLTGTPEAIPEALSSRSVDVKTFVISHSNLFLPEIYTFDIPTLASRSGLPAHTVERILRVLALKPGALVGSNPEHLFLDNPVWSRPIIEIGNGKFMAPLIQMVFSHLHLIVKRLTDKAEMTPKLDERRSEYLEKEIAEVLSATMPKARVSKNVKWSWQGAEYETDCLVCLDHTLLVVEAKSSRLTDEALRAAPGTLRKLTRKLVLNPSLQSARLLTVVESAKRGDADAVATCCHLDIDASDIDLVIRLSITLDDLWLMYTAELALKNAKWIPATHDLPVTMTIHNFKHVAHVLDNSIFLFHYLHERRFAQKRWNMIADEVDLLGIYLRNGLNTARVPATESDLLVLTGQSELIDRYYNARDAGFDRPKPKPHLRPLFRRIVGKLAASTPPRWTTIGRHVLSCAEYDQQKIIEKDLLNSTHKCNTSL